MKISLLLQREPFAAIVQRTLSKYLSRIRGENVSATWTQVPWYRRGKSPDHGEWLCHPQLNAIFSEHVHRSALDPIMREFSQSVAPLRRPFQSIYVKAALSRNLARWFASVRLKFDPAFPDEADQVIVPGNQKIRILNHRTRTATCIMKDGFPASALQRELNARQQAEACGVPTPKVRSFDLEAAWLREDYLSGTPLNRIPDASEQSAAQAIATNHLEKLLVSTQESVPFDAYLARLESELPPLLGSLKPRDPRLSQQLQSAAKQLRDAVSSRAHACSLIEIPTSLTHGDFQPANILVNQEGVWIIDWEHSGRRQRNYDYWVLLAKARFPQGLAHRMTSLCHSEGNKTNSTLVAGYGDRYRTPDGMLVSASLFFLEELAWRLREENHPLFFRAAPGLYEFAAEFLAWQKQSK
jgi:tRNA A-37 threonylcarbamoyl transferase component Bud32